MFSQLIERLFELIIPFVAKKLIKQSENDKVAERNYMATLKSVARLTRKPVIVAMIGLVGSGKSTVARKIAEQIGASVIEGDAIRVELRKIGERYDSVRIIAENIATEITNNSGSVVLDSDFIDSKKRAVITKMVKTIGAKLVFVRVICDIDVSIGRAINSTYTNSTDDFFGGATTSWQGEKMGSVVKIREMLRRLPQHYRWENKAGGKWVPKRIPVKVGVTIDTTDENTWPDQVVKLISKIK